MNVFNIFEWFFETLDKRLGQGIPLDALFLCVPNKDEAEFEYEVLSMFKTARRVMGISQGNALTLDYPNLAKLAAASNRVLKIRVFFIHPSRLDRNMLLNHKKFPYPKVNQKEKFKNPFDFSSTDRNAAIVEHAVKQAKLNETRNNN